MLRTQGRLQGFNEVALPTASNKRSLPFKQVSPNTKQERLALMNHPHHLHLPPVFLTSSKLKRRRPQATRQKTQEEKSLKQTRKHKRRPETPPVTFDSDPDNPVPSLTGQSFSWQRCLIPRHNKFVAQEI
jgi:hypothetical protein